MEIFLILFIKRLKTAAKRSRRVRAAARCTLLINVVSEQTAKHSAIETDLPENVRF